MVRDSQCLFKQEQGAIKSMNIYKQSALLLKRLNKDLDSELLWFGKLSNHPNKKELIAAQCTT